MRIIASVLLIGCAIGFVTNGCNPDESHTEPASDVIVRLPNEPDMLNPARSGSSYATQIESHIQYPLAEMDPVSYEMSPLLIEELNPGRPILAGPDSGGLAFDFVMRKEAVWDDGSPVTGHDYAFTIKMALNPKVDATQWRGFLTFISDVQIDPDDPRKFTVISENYMLADIIVCNFNIYPAYVYDPMGYLRDFSVRMMTDVAIADSLANADSRLQQFADDFMQVKYAKDICIGSGPYRLASWETGQHITLERKKDWWGDRVRNKPAFLSAYPEHIIYEIVPDENTALTMLKDGSIDVISEVTPNAFLELRSDSAFRDKLQFFTPKLLQFNYLELNTHKPILGEKNVRKALAHIVDYNGIIDNVVLGMAQRTVGPFNPDAGYYNKDIALVSYDLDKARALLAEAGWSDTNGNGVLDKMLSGVRTELRLDISVSQRIEGQTIALLLKESAAKVGMDLNVLIKDGAVLTQDARNRNFDILPRRNSADVILNDPYQTWHSDSDAPGGSNYSGFRNTTADSLITVIRTTREDDTRSKAYKAFQVVIAEEQPVVFLYVPLQRLIVSKRFAIQPSARKPGYFENLFQRAPL